MSDDKVICPSCGGEIDPDDTYGRTGRYRCPYCWHEFDYHRRLNEKEDAGVLSPDELKTFDLDSDDDDNKELVLEGPESESGDDSSSWLQRPADDYDEFSQPDKLSLQEEWPEKIVNCPSCQAFVAVTMPDVYRCPVCGQQFKFPEEVS